MRLPTMLPFGLTSICNEANCGRLEATQTVYMAIDTFHTIGDSKLFASRITSTCTGVRRLVFRSAPGDVSRYTVNIY